MIRALRRGLGIPARCYRTGKNLPEERFNPMDFPLEKWSRVVIFLGDLSLQSKGQAEELLEDLLAPLDTIESQMVYCRNGNYQIAMDHGLNERKESSNIS